MFLSRNNHRDILIPLAPCDDIHHWFSLITTNRHRLIETLEKSLIAVLTLGDDDKGWNNKVMNQGNLFVIIQRNDISKVARKSLPISLQRQDATGTCLEMKMIRS